MCVTFRYKETLPRCAATAARASCLAFTLHIARASPATAALRYTEEFHTAAAM
jgi:hypothetical protein